MRQSAVSLPYRWKFGIGAGYGFVFLWLVGSSVLAGQIMGSFKKPLNITPKTTFTVISEEALLSGVAFDNVTLPRDPFARIPVKELKPPASEPLVEPAIDTAAFVVKGLILSRKKGVVLEDIRRGQVIFLSEGERSGSVILKSVDKKSVHIEVDGVEHVLYLDVIGGVH